MVLQEPVQVYEHLSVDLTAIRVSNVIGSGGCAHENSLLVLLDLPVHRVIKWFYGKFAPVPSPYVIRSDTVLQKVN